MPPFHAARGLVAACLVACTASCSADRASAVDASESPPEHAEVAVFAGGCFWCMEPPFDALDGVFDTTSGYAGGPAASADYKTVTAGGTGHYESVQVTYDPSVVSYERLLEVFWRNVDPLDNGGQFCDRGDSYRTAIFVLTEAQALAAAASRTAIVAQLDTAVVTEIVPLDPGGFFPAEDYHQNYYLRNPVRYKYYRTSCGRDRRLRDVWGES